MEVSTHRSFFPSPSVCFAHIYRAPPSLFTGGACPRHIMDGILAPSSPLPLPLASSHRRPIWRDCRRRRQKKEGESGRGRERSSSREKDLGQQPIKPLLLLFLLFSVLLLISEPLPPTPEEKESKKDWPLTCFLAWMIMVVRSAGDFGMLGAAAEAETPSSNEPFMLPPLRLRSSSNAALATASAAEGEGGDASENEGT
jgi:hypothetical protein